MKEYGVPQLSWVYQMLGVLEAYQMRAPQLLWEGESLLWEEEVQLLYWKESWAPESFGKGLGTHHPSLWQRLVYSWLVGTLLKNPWVSARCVHCRWHPQSAPLLHLSFHSATLLVNEACCLSASISL